MDIPYLGNYATTDSVQSELDHIKDHAHQQVGILKHEIRSLKDRTNLLEGIVFIGFNIAIFNLVYRACVYFGSEEKKD